MNNLVSILFGRNKVVGAEMFPTIFLLKECGFSCYNDIDVI